jgi:dienelactone hydrolase
MAPVERIASSVSAAAFAAFLAGCLWMAHLERSGPAHADVLLAGGVPATLWLPREGAGWSAFLDPPERGERPPAVVLMHGFAGDRQAVSGFARRLAAGGYAVLAIDARGHGDNRNPYDRGFAAADTFAPDLQAATDFLRTTPFVDGSRLAVAGHSMGAGASLDYATRDSGIDAAVMLSGGWRMEGPYRPSNALFLYAEGDPDFIRERSLALAARLADVAEAEPGRRYGSPDRFDAVRAAEVPGANHENVVRSEAAVRETLAWLDAAFGVQASRAQTPSDPRAPALALLRLAFLLTLPGVGLLLGRLLPRHAELPGDGRPLALAALAASFALTLPLLAVHTPGVIVGIEVGDTVVSHFALAGIALLVGIRLRRPAWLAGLWTRPAATLLGAAAVVVTVFVFLQPLSAATHRMTLTPERSVAFALAAAGLLPFALAFNLLLRRGPLLGASLAALAGRALILGVLAAGVAAGVLGGVVLFMLPVLAAVCVMFEALAAALYARSRNLLAVSLVDAGWLALVIAAVMPIRF